MREQQTKTVVGLALGTVVAITVLLALAQYGSVLDVVSVGESVRVRIAWDDWLLLQTSAAHRLIGMLLLPIGQSVDHDFDILPQPGSGAWGIVELGILLVIAWHLRRSVPRTAYGIAWVVLVVAPRLIVQTPRSQLNEHQMYLAIPGAMLVVVDRVPVAVAQMRGWWETWRRGFRS